MFQYSNRTVFSRAPEGLKILMLAVFSILAISLTNVIWQAGLLFIVLTLLLVAGYKEFHKLLLALAPFILVMNLAFLYFMSAYRANVWEAMLLIDLRILLIFFSFAFFSFTTDLVAVVKLMKKAGLPEAIYLPFYVVLRFLPELERDHQEVRQLQKLKGITLRQPREYFKSLFLPLVYVVFDRADELSVAYYLKNKKEKE